jgi:hypothetical protein
MRSRLALSRLATIVAASAAFAGCASTMVTVTPFPQNPVCDSTASALVLWAPQWRQNQKDVPKREAAADAGLAEFLKNSGCFSSSELRRLTSVTPATVAAEIASMNEQFNKVVTITLQELGPVIRLFSSLALIESGTEVVLQVAEYQLPGEVQTRTFSVHWQNGGPGVIKGVASLPQDMQSALVIGLQPPTAQK